MGQPSLFGRIAPYYALFYNYQKRHYGRVLDSIMGRLGLSQYSTVLDVGCGTGALCAAWRERGFLTTGIDPEQKMIDIARKRVVNTGISFLRGDVLEGLPFADDSFDIVIASYVAHGLRKPEREEMYREMARVASHLVIIHDFNERRSVFVDFIETLEGGDYFGFIETAQEEIASSLGNVELFDVGARARWYVARHDQ
jgi:ubiquinone/menaquinone biosynthesis C-methylase UbiE